MPEQTQSSAMVKVIIGLIILLLLAGAYLFLRMNSEPAVMAPAPEEEQVTEEVTPEPEPEQVIDPAPAELSPSVEAQIRQISAQVDAGTMTREEAQEEVNRILGI